MSLPTPQEDSGLPADQTSSEMRLSRLETIIFQLGQSVQTIAEEMKSLKDSTLASNETVQECQQIIQEPDQMAAFSTEKQQQKFSPKNQQNDINKLLDAIPSNGIYQTATGGTFPKGTTDSRASFQKTSTPISGSCGKPVPFSLAADSMSPVKPLDNILHGDSTRFFSASGSLPTMSKQTNCDVPQVSEDLMHASSMPRASVVNSAPTVPFAASTTVGSMAPVAAPSQSTSSKRRKRHRYRSSSSSSDNSDSAPRNTQFAASTERGHESRRDRSRSHLNMNIPEFRDLPVNVRTEHGNERQRDRSRSKSPNIPKMATFKGTDSPNWEAFIYQFERTAGRRQWSDNKKLCRLLDCLGDVALEYARRVNVHNDYHTLKKYLKRRFSTKEAPVVARRQLPFLKQHENETMEEFSQRVYSLTLDAYEECEGDIIEEMAVEAFLRGCREKSAARHAMDMEPRTIHKALKFVKTALANDRALFGGRTNAYYHRQVTFQDESNKTACTGSAGNLQDQIDILTKAIETLNTNLRMPNRYSGPESRQDRFRSPSPSLRGRSPRRFSDGQQGEKLSDRSPMRPQYGQQDKSSAMSYYRQHETHSQSRAPSLSPVRMGSAKDEGLNTKGPGRQA